MPADNSLFFFAPHVVSWERLHFAAADSLYGFGTRTFIHHGFVNDFDFRDVHGLVDDCGIVHDDRLRTDWLKEPAFFDENKSARWMRWFMDLDVP